MYHTTREQRDQSISPFIFFLSTSLASCAIRKQTPMSRLLAVDVSISQHTLFRACDIGVVKSRKSDRAKGTWARMSLTWLCRYFYVVLIGISRGVLMTVVLYAALSCPERGLYSGREVEGWKIVHMRRKYQKDSKSKARRCRCSILYNPEWENTVIFSYLVYTGFRIALFFLVWSQRYKLWDYGLPSPLQAWVNTVYHRYT
jgi:hypothetical protein